MICVFPMKNPATLKQCLDQSFLTGRPSQEVWLHASSWETCLLPQPVQCCVSSCIWNEHLWLGAHPWAHSFFGFSLTRPAGIGCFFSLCSTAVTQTGPGSVSKNIIDWASPKSRAHLFWVSTSMQWLNSLLVEMLSSELGESCFALYNSSIVVRCGLMQLLRSSLLECMFGYSQRKPEFTCLTFSQSRLCLLWFCKRSNPKWILHLWSQSHHCQCIVTVITMECHALTLSSTFVACSVLKLNDKWWALQRIFVAVPCNRTATSSSSYLPSWCLFDHSINCVVYSTPIPHSQLTVADVMTTGPLIFGHKSFVPPGPFHAFHTLNNFLNIASSWLNRMAGFCPAENHMLRHPPKGETSPPSSRKDSLLLVWHSTHLLPSTSNQNPWPLKALQHSHFVYHLWR